MKLKWGVIGAAGIADRRTIPGIMLAENAELVHVMDVNADAAEQVRAKYHVSKASTSEDTLLADPEVEAVYIASPVIYHFDQVKKAAAAGKHILVEKPVALTSVQSAELIEVCDKAGVKAASGFMMRYHAYHQKMKELIAAGKLGKIISARAQLTCWYPDMPGNWRQQKSTSGGGALMDMGVHCIDLLENIIGGRAVKASAFSATKTFNYEVEDSALLIFEMDSGAFCHVDANFNIPDAAAKCRLEIYGTKGSMLAEGTIGQIEGGSLDVMLSNDNLGYDAKQDRNDVEPYKVDVEFGNMYAKEIESFGESVLSGKKLEIPLGDALHVQKVVEAAYESAKTGKHVVIG